MLIFPMQKNIKFLLDDLGVFHFMFCWLFFSFIGILSSFYGVLFFSPSFIAFFIVGWCSLLSNKYMGERWIFRGFYVWGWDLGCRCLMPFIKALYMSFSSLCVLYYLFILLYCHFYKGFDSFPLLFFFAKF